MAEAAKICAPPGLEAPRDCDPPGLDLPPGLPMPSAMMKLDGSEALLCGPPPGLEKPAPRSRAGPMTLRAKGASSSSSTSAASVTTEEPPSEELAPAYVAGCAGLSEEAEEQGEQWPTYGATIAGLPNKVLSEVMFEAVLEQASLSHLAVGFTLHVGKPCGEARVTFNSRMAAEQCAMHFQGCQWDPSGTPVTVSLDLPECPEHAEWEIAAMAAAYAGGDSLSAAAEVPVSALSCEAAVFVPSAGAMSSQAAPSGKVEGSGKSKALVVTSDTSTEVGESEAEDEHDAAGARRSGAARATPGSA